MRVDHDHEEAVRDRQLDDVERRVAADQHEAAEHRRCDIVGVRRAAGDPLTLHRARDQLPARERPAEQFVDGDGAGGCRRARAAEAARERHLLVQAKADARPDSLPGPREPGSRRRVRASTSWAATPATLRAGSRLRCPPSPVTSAISMPGRSIHSASSRSPGRCRQNPSTSKPGPTLDTEAGANTETRFKRAEALTVGSSSRSDTNPSSDALTEDDGSQRGSTV